MPGVNVINWCILKLKPVSVDIHICGLYTKPVDHEGGLEKLGSVNGFYNPKNK